MTAKQHPPVLLTVDEAMALLKISRSGIWRLRARGDITATKVGSQVRIYEDSVTRYLVENTERRG